MKKIQNYLIYKCCFKWLIFRSVDWLYFSIKKQLFSARIAEVEIKIHKTTTKVSFMDFNVNLCNPHTHSQFFSPVLKCGCL